MPYIVQAARADGLSGRFRAELDTLRAAMGCARDLKRAGFVVTVRGPEGELWDVPEDCQDHDADRKAG